MIAVDNRFARSYAAARRKFFLAAELAGTTVRTFPHPLKGPNGEEMATDVAWLGDQAARGVVVVTSGVHGPELFCGSAAQVDALLERGAAGARDVALLLVHAVNPYGTAWLRRTNEDNIDINRNFIDFEKPLPENPGYAVLADAFVPADAAPATMAAADARIAAYGREHGAAALRLATSGGHYSHPLGMFYGGTRPAWSRRTMEAILAEFGLARRTLVAALDFHTGAGPFGYCEPIYSGDPAHPGCARLKRWIGPAMTIQRDGKSATPPQVGLSSDLWERSCGPHAAYVSFEYGTVPTDEVIGSLRAEHILHRQGRNDWHEPGVQAVKQGLLDAFAPDRPEWREMVIVQARLLIERVVRGVGAEL
jgi:hypothetical protein